MLLACIGVVSLVFSLVFCAAQGAFSSLACLWMLPVLCIAAFVVLVLLAAAFFCIVCVCINTRKPQRNPPGRFYLAFSALYAGAITDLLRMRVHTVGLEQMPAGGRFLLVCNHLHILDPIVLYRVFHKYGITFLSKRENAKLPFFGKLMHKMRCPLLNRENDREALKTILQCVSLIRADETSIVAFPEGYTSKDHKLHPLRSGVLKIAQKAGVPIVVCTLQNTHRAFHNVLHLRATRVELHLVGVIEAQELKGVTAVSVGARVHEMMARDLGAENVLQENP